MTDDEDYAVDDEDYELFDAVTAVVADELCVQLQVRRPLGQIATLVSDELMRIFDISPRNGLPDPMLPERWPVVRHVSVDRQDRAHIELASLQWPENADEVQFALPSGGSIAVRQAEDGTVREIVIWPASRLLPADVQADRPPPTSAADVE